MYIDWEECARVAKVKRHVWGDGYVESYLKAYNEQFKNQLEHHHALLQPGQLVLTGTPIEGSSIKAQSTYDFSGASGSPSAGAAVPAPASGFPPYPLTSTSEGPRSICLACDGKGVVPNKPTPETCRCEGRARLVDLGSMYYKKEHHCWYLCAKLEYSGQYDGLHQDSCPLCYKPLPLPGGS